MDTIEGTDIGQVNLASTPQNSELPKMAVPFVIDTAFQPVGSQFAALNPPANLEKAIGIQGARIVNSNPIGGPAKAAETMRALKHPRKSKDLDLPIFGVVTIDNVDWPPRRLDDLPPSLTQGLGMELSAHFAMIYNQSLMAMNKHRWAVVTTRGTVLLLCGLELKNRPSNPGAFCPFVQGGLTYDQAERIAMEANQPRWQLSRIPRQWAVALRRADTVGKDCAE